MPNTKRAPPPTHFFFSSDSTSALSTLGRTCGKCVHVNWLIQWLEVWLYFCVSGFLIIPLLLWSWESLHNWQTCRSIACLKIAGWAWEPDRAKVKSATVWLNQCEPCIVSTFQGLDNEKHTVYSLPCCLHNWLVWSQVSTLLKTRWRQYSCKKKKKEKIMKLANLFLVWKGEHDVADNIRPNLKVGSPELSV